MTRRARVGITVFPGTNCEIDVAVAVRASGGDAVMLWHGDDRVGDVDAIVVPGGFAHGDYLRTGALARFSPVMAAVSDFAAAGGPVIGICNGFQILCEADLLPGALRRNTGLRFLCQPIEIEVVDTSNPITYALQVGQRLRMPINHFEGSYTVHQDQLDQLEDNGQVVARYVANPNGSAASIAAVRNIAGNVVGLMPHPERACDPLTGQTDGLAMFESLIGWVARTTQPVA